MFLLGEIVSKSHLISSFCLFGIEAMLTIFMLIYISKHEISYISESNISVEIMLAAAKVQ